MSEATQGKGLVRGVVVTSLLALCTIITSFQSNRCFIQELTAGGPANLETDRWTRFQAQAIQEHSFRLQMEVFELNRLLGHSHSGVQKFIEEKVKEYDEAVAQYEKEKSRIIALEEKADREREAAGRMRTLFDRATLLLQGAIVLSSMGMLLQKRVAWLPALAAGAGGLAYMMNGFFLRF